MKTPVVRRARQKGGAEPGSRSGLPNPFRTLRSSRAEAALSAASEKGELMNRTSKQIFRVAALACAAVLLFIGPRTALADDTTKPVATLYSPTTSAAVSANQKIILSLSELPAMLASDKTVTVTPDGTTYYTAYASDGVKIGSDSYGPWYVAYDLSKFLNGGTPLTLANGTTYTVAAQAGAFSDAASNTSEAMSDSTFTTVADGAVTDPVAVVYTTTNANQTVKAGETSINRGQAVANGTVLTFTIPADGSYTTDETVKSGGVAVTGADLSSYTLAADLEVYIVRTGIAGFSGTAAISGDAYYGGVLTGDVTGANQPDSSQWTFSWVRVDGGTDTPLLSGDITAASSYTLTEADIGKVIRLDVTDATLTGTLTATTAAITKAPYSGAAAVVPVADAITSTSITLKEVSGYEYSSDDTTFSSTRTFSVASAGTAITLYQRVAATATAEASASASASFTSAETLSGTISFSTAAQSGVALTASFTNAGTGTGPYSYRWTREGTEVATTATYTPTSTDVGKVLTVTVTSGTQSGSVSNNTSAVLKGASSAGKPAAPTMASATATSITLNAISGYQYSLGGVYWQDTTTFHNLAAGSAYTFYQRVAESATELASQPSDGVNFSTLPALTGTIMSSGEARYGFTLTVTLSGTNNTGTLTYTWLRGAIVVGSGQSYTVQTVDIGNQLSLQVTSSAQGGTITRSFGTVSKAYYYGDTPAAPTRSSRTTTKIVLTSVSGCEYSRDGFAWQDSTTFSGLSAGKSYTFYQRYKETTTMEASPTSAALKTYTSSSSSSSSTDDSSATPTPTPASGSTTSDDSNGSTTLYSYTLTSDNTRILYSTMKSLAAGNKTQDVVIKQSDVEITFPKGTMTDSYTQLWYDFGTTINNSIAEQTAKSLAGDAYVATIHFNYSGELPGKADIRFWLGAAQAGKTLYYYRLEDDNTLTFMQTSTVDSTGWASVSQTSCSDYVFLSSEYGTAAGTPSAQPTSSSGLADTPVPTASADQPIAGMSADGWFVIAIIVIAVALIVGGIWLYTKSRDDRIDDDDDEF